MATDMGCAAERSVDKCEEVVLDPHSTRGGITLVGAGEYKCGEIVELDSGRNYKKLTAATSASRVILQSVKVEAGKPVNVPAVFTGVVDKDRLVTPAGITVDECRETLEQKQNIFLETRAGVINGRV